MNGFVKDIESLAVRNDAFRQVLYTAKNCQLVLHGARAEGGDRGRRFARASPCSSPPGRSATSSIPAHFDGKTTE